MGEPIVTITSGKVRGVREDGVTWFRGIPYAAPPVGDLRFALPADHAPWSDVRDATVSGPSAPQVLKPFPALDVAPLVGAAWVQGDDYLTASIWTPDPQAKGLPVMVFIHGGAFVLGCNDTGITDGGAFARSGVVLIAINYRLGIDGFVPIPGAPTNLGLRDQIAALKWVQRNAAAFGGDPDNVTVFGESAGAMSVANLVASPLARGLFRRAIIQSGHGSMVRPISVASRLTQKLARMMRITPDLAGFRSTTTEQCLKALDKVSSPTARIDLRDETGREPTYGLSRFLPVYGDDVLPEAPLKALARGVGAEVELLIGTNREEMNLYFVPTGVRNKIPRIVAEWITSKVEPKAREVFKAYGMGQKGRKSGHVYTTAMTDMVFRLPARWFAAAHQGKTHLYELEWKCNQFGGELGACHAIEMPFVFNTLACCTGPQGFAGTNPPQALADRIHGIWVNFARSGELPWPQYDTKGRQVFSLEAGVATSEPVMPAERILS